MSGGTPDPLDATCWNHWTKNSELSGVLEDCGSTSAPTPVPTETPTPSPTSAPTPTPSRKDYALSSTGATKCPSGFAYITNLDECNLARKAMGEVDRWNGENTKTHSDRMPFCWVGRGDNANYNAAGDWGATFSGSKLLCKRASTPDYALASTGATKCPRGFAYITNLDECNLARKAVDEVDRWNGENTKSHSDRMPFCWVGRGDNANYNAAGDWGATFSGSKLLCKRYEFALMDGAPGGGRSPAEVSDPDPTKTLGEVQCCRRNGVCTRKWLSGRNKGKCMSGNNNALKYTLQGAVGLCGQLGSDWGLCTRAQTNNDNCRSKGCAHDHKLVWVRD